MNRDATRGNRRVETRRAAEPPPGAALELGGYPGAEARTLDPPQRLLLRGRRGTCDSSSLRTARARPRVRDRSPPRGAEPGPASASTSARDDRDRRRRTTPTSNSSSVTSRIPRARSLDGPFDVIVLSDTVGSLEDCQRHLRTTCTRCVTARHRVVISYYSRLWGPVLSRRVIGQKMPQTEQNWLAARDIAGLLRLADFEVVRLRVAAARAEAGRRPRRLRQPLLGTLPGIRRLCLRNYVVARSTRSQTRRRSVGAVVIPCRNEAGNIAPAIDRLPRFCDDIEFIFVEGHSQRRHASTEIERVDRRSTRARHQAGASGRQGQGGRGTQGLRRRSRRRADDPRRRPHRRRPRTCRKFYEAIASGKGELVMGTRLVYPMEQEAMRALNIARQQGLLAAVHVAPQPAHHRHALRHEGDLSAGTTTDQARARLLRRVRPVRRLRPHLRRGQAEPQDRRGPGALRRPHVRQTQISRFRHGVLLPRMVVFAFRKLKAI